MAIKQPPTIFSGAIIPLPVLNVELAVLPDFTGRVVLYIENGRVKCDRRLLDDEHICAMDTFIEMAREVGWPLQELS